MGPWLDHNTFTPYINMHYTDHIQIPNADGFLTCIIHIIFILIRQLNAFPGAMHWSVFRLFCINLSDCVFGFRWGSSRALMNTWVWKEQEEAKRCWWVTTLIQVMQSTGCFTVLPLNIRKEEKHSLLFSSWLFCANYTLCGVFLYD